MSNYGNGRAWQMQKMYWYICHILVLFMHNFGAIMHKLYSFQPLMVSDWMKCNSSCPSIERTESSGWTKPHEDQREPDTCAIPQTP